MANFEELELSPELVEALASEGIEVPTELQGQLIPVVRRGNNVVAVAGPGSGIMAAYAAPLLERIPAEGDAPRILVLAATADRATALAESLGRLAAVTGHRVAALDPLWVLPGRAQVVVATPEEAGARLSSGQLSLESVEAVVVDGASSMAATGSLPAAATLLEGLKPEAQRIVVSLPVSAAVESFVDSHVRRAVHVPPQAAEAAQGDSPFRGKLVAMEFDGPRETAALQVVANLLLEARHVMAFVRSEDVAADLGDFLGLRGYMAGRPGDTEVPVWLAVGEMEARNALDESSVEDVAILSVDVPGDADSLDRRHGSGREGVVLVHPRELPHLKATARGAGYSVEMQPLPRNTPRPTGLSRLLTQVDLAIAEEDVDAYQALLEPFFEKHGAATVAAAAVALLRKRHATAPPVEAPAGPGQVPAFVRLFVSVGKRDNVGPGDLVGAIAGEAGIDSAQVGRIDLRESFSLVEVEGSVADRVIKALNGTTIRGRATRVDYHREDRSGGRGSPSGEGGRGGAPSGGGRGPGGGGRGPSGGGRPPSGGGRGGPGRGSSGAGGPRGGSAGRRPRGDK